MGRGASRKRIHGGNPRGASRKRTASNKQSAGSQTATQALSGHVLVAEDNAVNRALIGTYLSEFGLSHEMVSIGNAAAMSVAAKTYDLVCSTR